MSLNMHPKSVPHRASKKALAEAQWFICPWRAEAVDSKKFRYVPPVSPRAGEDGDGEVVQVVVGMQLDPPVPKGIRHVASEEEGDGADDLVVLESETRHAIQDLLSISEQECPCECEPLKNTPIVSIVTYDGKGIYKATLVSQLNASPFLSKNRLTRVENSFFFNNAHTYMLVAESSHSCLLGLGADCAIFFLGEPILGKKKRWETLSKKYTPYLRRDCWKLVDL